MALESEPHFLLFLYYPNDNLCYSVAMRCMQARINLLRRMLPCQNVASCGVRSRVAMEDFLMPSAWYGKSLVSERLAKLT